MENYTEITAFPYGTVSAPPSKSAAHRSLICAALAGAGSKVSNLELSKDIEATLRCIKAMGGEYNFENGSLEIIKGITKPKNGIELDCGESGSTLRFFIPIAAAFGTEVTFVGAKRLFERPLQPYYDTFKDRGIDLFAEGDSLTVTGRLGKGLYILAGNVSSQFVTGLLLSLGIVGGGEVRISTPLESKGYVDLTIAQMKLFG
ncbi:MAG: 3-phosphoshikimate 1-carboxyvinyltransferase, partial [Oscillospiraceae bacterium]